MRQDRAIVTELSEPRGIGRSMQVTVEGELMAKHKAVASPARAPLPPRVAHRRTRPRPPVHRVEGMRVAFLTMRRVGVLVLGVGAALTALAPTVSGGGSPRASVSAGSLATPPPRPDPNQRPADRGSRPSPSGSLLSALESLSAAASHASASASHASAAVGATLGPTSSASALLPSTSPVPARAVAPTQLPTKPTAQAPATPKALGASPSVTVAAPRPTVSQAATSAPAIAAPYVPVAAGYPFSATSVWRQSVTGASLASDSATLVGSLASTVTSLYNGVAAFNVDSYNTTYYTVGPDTPKSDVKFDNCQSKSAEPAALAAQFAQVPIPSDAVPAAGTDAEMTIYSPSTDQLWEFWVTSHRADGWYACWGGRMDHVSSGPGYFSGGMGATATGLPVAGGMVSIADVKAGAINHAMSLEILNAAPWNDFSYPAQRSDGSNNSPTAIPEGTRFRLDPSINVNSLNLTPLAKMIAKAAQTYGFIVTDQSGAVAVQAQNAAGASSNPWPALMAGVPSYKIMANFPWSQLQALPKNWGE